MAMLELDHLAVSARTLSEGRDAVETTLGVALQAGGAHRHFGTHNLLLGLSDGLYLEVIAIDPGATPPEVPRWFDLDRFDGKPRLTNWICRTGNLTETLKSHPEAGDPVRLSRGNLRWTMAVPGSGRLPYDGMFPALIEWQGEAHPVQQLAASECRLERLVVRHPSAHDLAAALRMDRSEKRLVFETGAPGLRAEIQTPLGLRVLD